ncbi:MAG: ATP-dependent sacrificial sulfur transferase LarE [Planctomycetota bacterium]
MNPPASNSSTFKPLPISGSAELSAAATAAATASAAPPAVTPEFIAACEAKETALRAWLQQAGRVLVAYSGGVDSTYLAFVAHAALGAEALAVTAHSPSLAPSELAETKDLAARFGFAHRIVATHEVDNPAYRANDGNRCHFCKSELMTEMQRLRVELGFETILLGAIVDDIGDHRPGEKAALSQGAAFPLRDVGLSKREIRWLSEQHGLPTADKPASACLSSRFAYGTEVTADRLAQVAAAEDLLHTLGFRACRVRVHDVSPTPAAKCILLARIEVPAADIAKVTPHAAQLAADFKRLGYTFVSLDLAGYKSGNLNAAL